MHYYLIVILDTSQVSKSHSELISTSYFSLVVKLHQSQFIFQDASQVLILHQDQIYTSFWLEIFININTKQFHFWCFWRKHYIYKLSVNIGNTQLWIGFIKIYVFLFWFQIYKWLNFCVFCLRSIRAYQKKLSFV